MTNPTNTLDISGTLGVTGLSTLSGGLTSTAGDTTLGKTGTGALTAASLNVTGDLLTNTIKSTTNSTTFTLCGNQTDGQIDIGGGEGRTGNINIGYNVGGGSIHIGADAIGTHNIVVGTNASSSTYIRGKDINVGDNQTSGKINIGTGTSRTGDVTIGHTGSNIIMNATNIKQTVKIQSGQSIYNVLGNTVNYPSLSTTFNFKAVIPVGPVRCYRLTRESNTFNITKYFELVVCGSNTYYGPYTAKFNFIFTTYPVISITQQITILSSYGVFLTSTKIDDNTLDLFIETSATDGNGPYGGGQQFITTLTGYPTCDGGGVFRDCIITAV
jgi:hypothetical protein